MYGSLIRKVLTVIAIDRVHRHRGVRCGILLCLVFVAWLNCSSQSGNSVTYFSTVRPVANSGGMYAVDGSGNIYVMSSDSSSILKETLFGGSYIQSTVCAASPGDVLAAGDDSGDVFRLSGGTLYEEVNQIQGPSYESDYTEKTVYSTSDNIISMAVDSKDNVYILDATQNELLRLTPTSSGYTQSFVATGLTGAVAVGVDANGNVYALEVNGSSGSVEQFADIGTGYAGSEFSSGLTSAAGWPGMAVDPSGNIYLQLDTFEMTEIHAGTGKQISIPCPPDGCPVINSGGGYNFAGFLAGPDGNFYFGYYGTVYKETFSSPDFGTVDAGSAATAYLAFQAASASGGMSAALSGAPFSDYGAGQFSCLPPGFYVGPVMPFCYVAVTFTPPGLALYQGTLKLEVPATQATLVTVTLQGRGAAPQIGFAPAAQSIILSGSAPYNLQGPEGIAVDGKGNLYIADTVSKQVLKEALSNGQYTQSVVADAQNGLRDPIGVAVDSSGNVYIADPMVGILKETLTSSGYTQSTAIPNGGPVGVAVDSSGTMYFVNGTSVIKAVPSGGQYTETTLLSSLTPGNGAISTQGIAVDSGRNLYVTDTGNQRVLKLSPANGSYTQSTIASGFGFPWGVAVDPAGNVYVGDEGGGVYEESLSNGVYSETLMNGSIGVAYGVAVDGSENVYAATLQPAYIYEIPAIQTTTLRFASTPVGTTSPDSPQTLTVQNVGLYPLTFTIPGTGTNPSVSAGFVIGAASGTASSCLDLFTSSTSAELMPGGTCTYQISFAPTTTGAISGSLTFTDNSDNVAGATQIVSLLGNATAAAPTVQISATSLNFNAEPVGSISAYQTITLTNSGTAALAISSISASGDFDETQNCGSTVAAGASCTISVKFTPTATGTRTGSVTITDNANGAPQTVALSGTGTTPVTTAPAVSLSPTSLSFTSQADGSTSTAQTVTLTNSGTAALSVTSITASDNFAETNTCGNVVAAGANCTIAVTFTPTSGGSLTGAIKITDNAPDSPETVALTGTGSTVTITTPSTSLTVSSAGGSATASIQVGSAGGFSGIVNLSCSVDWQGAGTATDMPTCSLNPTQEQVTSGSTATTTLTVNTTASSTAQAVNPWLHGGEGALAALLLFGVVPRKKWKQLGLMFVFVLIAMGAISGCGGGSTPSSGVGSNSTPGTSVGSYVVTVTATSGTATAATQIPLSVQ